MYTAAALTCLLALPLAFADAQSGSPCIQYGSPGIMNVQSIAKTPGPGACDNINIKTEGKYAVRLPSYWMNGTGNCGKNLTIYFTPLDVDGLSAGPTPTSEEGVVVDECPSATCESFESSVDDELFQMMDPGSHKPSKATPTPKVWGPAFVITSD